MNEFSRGPFPLPSCRHSFPISYSASRTNCWQTWEEPSVICPKLCLQHGNMSQLNFFFKFISFFLSLCSSTTCFFKNPRWLCWVNIQHTFPFGLYTQTHTLTESHSWISVDRKNVFFSFNSSLQNHQLVFTKRIFCFLPLSPKFPSSLAWIIHLLVLWKTEGRQDEWGFVQT